MSDALLSIVSRAARACGQSISAAREDDVRQLLNDAGNDASVAVLRSAWITGSLEGKLRFVKNPRPQDCPFVAVANGQWVLVQIRRADGGWVAVDANGNTLLLKELTGECAVLPPRHREEATGHKSSKELIFQALARRKVVFGEALLATVLVNLLALASSLYSMQVYDRVIPNHGYQTLFVLTVGVAGAALLELLLRNVRARAMDRTAKLVDHDLSEWFFNRALGIRLERRPASVGTLAAQIKGFELVRGAMSSSTLFLLADIPFALLFIMVILAVGGWLALVPLALLPVSLAAGMLFQRRIDQATRASQGQNNRKTGLLVESVDGAESLKANNAEWTLLRRWNRLVEEAGESDETIKHYSSLAQHATMTLQQVAYVALVAWGAYLVAENQLTMGALIACSIISGRALSPIAQLPSTLVQWGHAKAAMEGLDKLIGLPNEQDDALDGLLPEKLDAAIRLDRVRFAYGGVERLAVEIPKLEIKAGEKVGIIGPIGSGKSTLLKMSAGLYRPNEGRVFLGGMDMAHIVPQALRERVCYLPQEIHLISGTLRENLLQGLPDPGDEALIEAARRTGLMDLVAAHPKGLALTLTEGGRGISGGQKQLIGFTRLLLAKPSVLVLDEPTSSMDAISEARVVALVRALAAAGATVLVATHKTAFFPALDRLIVMQGGQVALDGSRDQVLASISGKAPAVTAATATPVAAAV